MDCTILPETDEEAQLLKEAFGYPILSDKTIERIELADLLTPRQNSQEVRSLCASHRALTKKLARIEETAKELISQGARLADRSSEDFAGVYTAYRQARERLRAALEGN